MFDRLLTLLGNGFDQNRGALSDEDARLSLTALLVRAARADGVYDECERALIHAILQRRFTLSGEEAAALQADGETLEAQAPDTVRFTRAIKEHVPLEHRVAVIEALWEVVLSDGSRDAEEDSLLRLVSDLLGITDVESARARQRVSARGGCV